MVNDLWMNVKKAIATNSEKIAINLGVKLVIK